MIILKRTLILLSLLIGLVAIALGVFTVSRLVVATMLGSDIVNGALFYFAVVVLTLIAYFSLVVFAIRSWETVSASLRNRYPKAFKR